MRVADTRRTVLRLCLTVIITLVCCALLWLFVFVIPSEKAHLAGGRERVAWWFLTVSLKEAQLDFALSELKNTDGDGVGEFGSLAEILEREDPPGGRALLADISSFKAALGEAQISDYYLARIFVPEDSDAAEEVWCAVAWPLDYGRGGVKTSFLYFWSSRETSLHRHPLGRSNQRRFSGWGHGPTLSDIFVGKPFHSGINRRLWK